MSMEKRKTKNELELKLINVHVFPEEQKQTKNICSDFVVFE